MTVSLGWGAKASGPGSDQASLSGAAGAISGNGLALALGLPCESLLKSQNPFADLAPAIFHNRWLPLSVRFAQFLNQAAGKPILGQGSLESVLALEFFALLRGEISFEENFAWIVLLRESEHRCGKEKCGREPSRPASRDTMPRGLT